MVELEYLLKMVELETVGEVEVKRHNKCEPVVPGQLTGFEAYKKAQLRSIILERTGLSESDNLFRNHVSVLDEYLGELAKNLTPLSRPAAHWVFTFPKNEVTERINADMAIATFFDDMWRTFRDNGLWKDIAREFKLSTVVQKMTDGSIVVDLKIMKVSTY